jgi:glycerol kinase
MSEYYIVALDQGTTSCRALLFDATGLPVGVAQQEFTQFFPQPGWVEHDPDEIWETQLGVLERLVREHNVDPSRIAALGITNQRETTILWNRKTGQAIGRAIVWQDRRTAPECESLKTAGLTEYIRQTTGLVIDPYFSGTKIRWMLDHIAGARDAARRGDLLFGTVDSWLIWKLTEGRVHATDVSNASRTLLFNVQALRWDERLLEALAVPRSLLPEVRDSSGDFGEFVWKGARIPICGVAGDQQAALFGQGCFVPGTAKNTYGTGCFLLMNTGDKFCPSPARLIATVAWRIGGRVQYAVEGSVLIAGAALQWLRDGLGILDSAASSEQMARAAGEANDVCVVPAFAGLGAPYWDMYARGAIFGLTRDTNRAQIVKATLESLAFQTQDVLTAMRLDTGIELERLRVDGGAAANDYLMQFQADLLGIPVERPVVIESTAQGAAGLAGLAIGWWDLEELGRRRRIERTFTPTMQEPQRAAHRARWNKAVQRTLHWLEPESGA